MGIVTCITENIDFRHVFYKLNKEQNVQVCDARGDAILDTAGIIKNCITMKRKSHLERRLRFV
jgi:hypothetical protein